MNTNILKIAAAALCIECSAAYAASVVTTSTIDGGGGHSVSGQYKIDSSIAGIGGIGSAGGDTANNGYIDQLTEVASVSVTSTPNTVNETTTSQLSGTATLDDSTVVPLAGGDISWAVPSYPVAAIDGSGLATASAVYASTNGTFVGAYLGVSTNSHLFVVDSNPDNYGSYASDGISDSWQVQYFGLGNPSAAPNVDADGTGQNNLFKYVAGLDPTNPASIFVLKIANVNGQPGQKNLIYNPIASGRTYTPQFVTNLHNAAWTTLSSIGGVVTNVNQVTLTDLGATNQNKFYRIDISLP